MALFPCRLCCLCVEERSDIQASPFVLPVDEEAAEAISGCALLHGVGLCKGTGFGRAGGGVQQHKDKCDITWTSFPPRLCLYFLYIFSQANFISGILDPGVY